MRQRRALRQFTLSTRKSNGRNSSGRITVFHRGGGSKRLQRRIDLKRSTSSIGIVERIEYAPNRSSRIAPVRWTGEGVRQRKCNTIKEFAPPCKILESKSTTTTICSPFSFSSLPGKGDQRKVACFSPRRMATYVVVRLSTLIVSQDLILNSKSNLDIRFRSRLLDQTLQLRSRTRFLTMDSTPDLNLRLGPDLSRG
ncbi:60S ribosomal protein L2 [Datura stramonium]|uniref:60S ribosomal protein L2 n=1 Tax=Datura stramonium TaxID=4076 RepID=A0ABS8RHI9_DATST|nr:60S ribosomal protein L2 [Datura stramonium]